MSRLTSGWDVGRSLGRCSITGAQLEPGARIVAALVDDATSAAGLPVITSRVGTLVGIYLGDALGGSRLPINFDEAKKTGIFIFYIVKL